MTQTIFLDAGSIADLVIAGDSGFSVLVGSGDQFVTTQYVIDELGDVGTPRRDAFDTWSSGRNDFQVLDIDIDLTVDTPETRQLGVGFRADGTPTQLGDASVRWLERETGVISDGSVRVLTNDRGLASWANNTAPNGTTGAYSSTLELIGEALLDQRIQTGDYSSLISDLDQRIQNNYSPEFQSLVFSSSDLAQLSDIEARGISLSGTSIVSIAAGVEVLRQAGVVGDIFGLAVTAAHASELSSQGRNDEAQQVWAGYFGDVAGGAAGALAGTLAAAAIVSATGVGAPVGVAILLAGALIGGYGGSLAGEAFGTYLADELQARIANGEEITIEDITNLFNSYAAENDVNTEGYVGSVGGGATGLWDQCFGREVPIDMWPLDPDLKPGPDGIYDQDEVRAKVWKKPIELIRVGDIVVSFDENDNLVPGPVTRTFANNAKILLNFHGTRVTPGHVYYRPDSKKSYKYETLIDVLRDDGVIKHQDGTLIRATTNVSVDSPRDGFVQAVARKRNSDGTFEQSDAGRIRLGTRFLVGTGKERKSWAVADLIEHGGGVVGDDELIRVGDGEPVPFLWELSETLPKPEDFVLACSGTTLEDIYKAAEWESQGPRLPAPMVLDRGSVQPLKGAALSAMPRNEPLDVTHSTMASAKPQRALNRKQRKAMEAKQRKAAKSRKRIAV